MNMNPRKRCVICKQWYIPDPRTKAHQQCCSRPDCKKKFKVRANKSWCIRHPGYDTSRKLKKRDWAQKQGGYWRQYRREHPEYRDREKQRMQDNRDRAKNVANQDAIGTIFVEKLQSIQCNTLQNVANQDMMARRLNSLIDCLVWKERVANQDDTVILPHSSV